MLPQWMLVGFTGHRQVANSEVVTRGLRAVLDRLEKSSAPLAAVSSVASGWDTLFLEEAVRRKLPFFLILPFKRARFQLDFSPTDWNRAEAVMREALDCEEIAEADTDNEAYLEAGKRTVDQTDVLLTVWNWESAVGIGGTADVVSYARSLGKPVIIINATTGEIQDERCIGL